MYCAVDLPQSSVVASTAQYSSFTKRGAKFRIVVRREAIILGSMAT
jgi:hypothetical protein